MRKGGWFWLIAGGGVVGVALLLRSKNANAAASESADSSPPAPPDGPETIASPAVIETPAQPAPNSPPVGEALMPGQLSKPTPAVDEQTALARVIRSEAGSHTPAEQRAVAWVARNRARKAGTSIARLVCTPECGPGGKARPFSSRRPARAAEMALAAEVLAANPAEDPTGGAWSAFEPALQDQLVREGRPGYRKTAAEVRRDWLRSSDYYGTVGRWELFGPKGGARARTVAPPDPRRTPRPGTRPEPRRHPEIMIAQNKPRLPRTGTAAGRATPPKGAV